MRCGHWTCGLVGPRSWGPSSPARQATLSAHSLREKTTNSTYNSGHIIIIITYVGHGWCSNDFSLHLLVVVFIQKIRPASIMPTEEERGKEKRDPSLTLQYTYPLPPVMISQKRQCEQFNVSKNSFVHGGGFLFDSVVFFTVCEFWQ